jgi:hypothetical protein
MQRCKKTGFAIGLALALVIVLGIVLISYKCVFVRDKSREGAADVPMLPGEVFIRSHMVNPDGTLKTRLLPPRDDGAGSAREDGSLSESLGLWLLYLVEKGDQPLFRQNVDVLKQRFMKPDGWIYWRIGGGKTAANALIDDLRIAEALYLAADKWQSPQWRELANTISRSVIRRQTVGGLFADFYDYESGRASGGLTLSYLAPAVLEKMRLQGLISDSFYQGMLDFLRRLPLRQGFFPYSCEIGTGKYLYHDEINMIDQLYLVYHRAQAGIPSPQVWSFVHGELAGRGILYGRYDARTHAPAVQYQSPAVYALAILSAIELGEDAFARDLYYRMIRLQIRNPDSEVYGGYVDGNDAHIFDNLLPLLAERRLYNEGILH